MTSTVAAPAMPIESNDSQTPLDFEVLEADFSSATHCEGIVENSVTRFLSKPLYSES